jgi:uncharacterized protein involved in type VI secretion and phage assembly
MPRIDLSFESGEESLSVRRFAVREAVSELFTVSIWARSREPSLDLDALVGQAAALHVEGEGSSPLGRSGRGWTGSDERRHASSSAVKTGGALRPFLRGGAGNRAGETSFLSRS